MSSSIKSKTSNTQLRLTRRRYEEENMILKPFGFCCSIDDIDPPINYNKLQSFYKFSSISVHTINESPTLKFQAQFADSVDFELKERNPTTKHLDNGDHKCKLPMKHRQILNGLQSSPYPRIRGGSSRDDFKSVQQYEDLYDPRVMRSLNKPLQWYLEDEIALAKDIMWKEKQKLYNEEMDRNTLIGKKNFELFMKKEVNTQPRWYQDFSIRQMKNLMMLQCVMHKDCEEMVTGRTQRTLSEIGITSTFFTLKPHIIKKLHVSHNCNAIEFLREIYKILTGNYFEEEGYRKVYDSNERIILSAIAFLTLPEAVVELHERLPPVIMPKFPPKPVPPTSPIRKKMPSPYEEELFIRPDWASYYNRLQHWEKQCQLMPIPNIILPPKDCILSTYRNKEMNFNSGENKSNKLQNLSQNNQQRISIEREQEKNIPINSKQKYDVTVKVAEKTSTNTSTNNPINKISINVTKEKQRRNVFKEKPNIDIKNEEHKQLDIVNNTINTEERTDIPQLPNGSKVFDFTINGVSEMPGPVEYKICGVLQPPQPNKKSWLGEKHAHYIISGAADEPPTCPVTYEMTGIANVTPTNSDERFFAVLKLGDGDKKIYPNGRENLSPKWQEWLQNADEEFREVEREANNLIKRIEAVTRLVFREPTCDSCCSCRQTRKSYLKAKETKSPFFVIDTIAEDKKKNKCIVGSMAMHSPAPTPPESTVNLLEVIASEDVLKTNVLINGITNEKGETQYFISGFKKDIVRVPARIVEHPPPRPPRNVPPCVCAVQQIFEKGLTPPVSHDHIPWTKEDGLCFGKKFRPNESPALSCKLYPGDKSCRRNPFIHDIMKLKRRAEKAKQKAQKDASPEKKRMYSIADFQPCGDEHGMGICGGPWGALHTLTPEELAEQERLRKEILRGPPCGTKPGRAICEGPFGERVPFKKQEVGIEEIPGEFDEEDFDYDDEEEEEPQKPPEKVKEKEKKRDKKCHMSPDSIASRKKGVEKKEEKFIPDPTYPGYDDPWNIFRTAPSEKESETDFKKLLKLSSPKRPSTPVESKTLVSEHDQVLPSQESSSQKDVSKSITKEDSAKVRTRDSEKKSLDSKQKKNERITKQKSRSIEREGTRETYPKSPGTRTEAKGALDKVTRSEVADDKIKDQKLLKSKRSKSSHKKVNETNVSSRNIKEESKSYQVPEIPKQSKENVKSKMKPEKMGTLTKKLSKRFDTKSKRDEKASVRKSKDNETRLSKNTATHRKQLNKRSKTKFEDSVNIKIDKQIREGTKVNKLSKKQTVPTGTIVRKKASKSHNLKKKTTKRDRKKDMQIIEDIDIDPKKQILNLKEMLNSSELYPHDVKPVDLPEEPPRKCALEYEDIEDTDGSVQTDKETDVQLPSKGPCGWRTKSEQQLPTKKTLVYLAEPDYPPETIAVREGGKPCLCRENRNKKKVLLYNIGGLIGGKKDDEETKKLKRKKDEDDKKMQVIDGVIYHTPPPSPRRSDEYVPEYDLYKSPYDMCLTKRRHPSLKLLEEHSGPKDVILESLKRKEPCGCNEYTDIYDNEFLHQNDEEKQTMKEFNKTRQELIEEKSQKERWNLSLKDTGLIDYFTRCRDSMPCWLKCAKFNKVGCKIPRPRLKIKRPVCECKYERKILEHKEEKMKWKERRQRLKSLKKQPFMNIMDTSKPVVVDTKLMISGVKRIPKEDEYVDDVKYCITGVAENYSELPPEPIVGGVQMATPIHTPEPSIEELPCVCLHRHWSPIHIPPGPLPKKEEIMLAEKKRRQKAAEDAYRQIHAPIEAYDTHDSHSCKKSCNLESNVDDDDEDIEENNNVTSNFQEDTPNKQTKTNVNPSKRIKPQLQNKNKLITDNSVVTEKLKKNKNVRNETNIKKISYNLQRPEHKETEANVQKSSYISQKPEYKENDTRLQQTSYNHEKPRNKEIQDHSQLQDTTMKSNANIVESSNKENNETSDNSGTDLMILAQNELKKMAVEGFLFAKLPKCFLMPQLQYWLIYRKGFALSDEDRDKSINKSVMMWDLIDVRRSSKIEPPPLNLTKDQLRNLTFDYAEEIKEKIREKKEIFYSQVRKDRILYSRAMWNTMDYGKFPSISFKEAYFTYMANREADGHVFKPWQPSEIREMTN
ncbi:uncharacterized protein LOC128894926 [Hylaeus anthracinus]|uniref:uncharacterized protein LOC128894926 n=1 Tax=Hylaeus anthracinus TaxID=313031 RepID=UPI0023BA3AFF|nr:uncharacterized protein LOC128894926 [Hylaeus anthracinus]